MMHHNDTTTPQTHTPECYLGDEILLGYLQGTLHPGESLLVATQYHMCPTTRERLKTLNVAVTTAAGDLEPKAMNCCPYKFFEERCLKSKLPEEKKEECETGQVPKPLWKYAGKCFHKIKWSTVMPGIQQKRLCICGKAKVKLMKIAPGTKIPEHTHAGEEYTLVLEGSFIDGKTRYTPGAVSTHSADEKQSHAPYTDEGCICLNVLTAPIVLSGFWGRLLNPILRLGY